MRRATLLASVIMLASPSVALAKADATIAAAQNPAPMTADERAALLQEIADLKRRAETQKYLEKLRASATITWHNDELKKAYEQALVERKKQLGTEEAKPAA